MRPLNLEMSGFSSFRDPVQIDFEGADVFVLVGQTGSGKSSIVDAICFALYGSVPRLDHKGKVGPVITKGANEAKVRFDFEVNGRAYTAARVVRRTGPETGTTKEARLESEGEVLAGSEKELSQMVTDLLGLEFEHFTRCVALPQGEFAEFLHARPDERRDMLIKLLGLQIYDQMMQLAKKHAAEEKERVAVLEGRLADVEGGASPEALREARARVKRLTVLRKTISDAQPQLKAFESEARQADERGERSRDLLALLKDLEMPDELEGLNDDLAQARKRVEEARVSAVEAGKIVQRSVEKVAELPDKVDLSLAARNHHQRADLDNKLAPAKEGFIAAEERRTAATATLEAAKLREEQARRADHDARHAHLALELAGVLQVGDDCPVCQQAVEELPQHPMAPELDAAAEAVETASADVRAAEEGLRAATVELTKRAQSVTDLVDRVAELDADLAEHPDLKKIKQALDEITTAEKEEKDARQRETQERGAEAAALAQLKEIQELEIEEREHLHVARDALAALKPPRAGKRDLVADWETLIEWAETKVGEVSKDIKLIEKELQRIQRQEQRLFDELLAGCKDCEIDVEGRDVLEPVARAAAEADAEVRDIEAALEKAKALRRQLKESEAEQELMASLGYHLSGSGFKQWIVDEALGALVQGATAVLRQMSNDQYSLTIDSKGNFLVIDHHNADEKRSAKTLSGGETFQASLALALALSDQLMELAAEGSAKLEALFLDEGFGTLDPGTLDAVADAMDSLVSEGRMVGLITHVQELADRIPLQFRVKKDLRTSHVERVGP